MADIENGCIGLGEKPTDFILTEWLLDALPTLYQQDEIIYQYNQWAEDRSTKSCTLFSPIGAISDLFNVEVPQKTIKKRDDDSYSKGRVKNSGWYVAYWVDHIVKEWNESEFAKEYWKAAYYSIDLKNDDLVKGILDKRYTICTWYQGNANYNKDKRDGVLENTSFGSPTYGHAVNAIWSINDNPQRIKDNYYKSVSYNIYDVAHPFSDLSCFYDKGYVITKVAEDALEEVKRLNAIIAECNTLIEHLGTLWHMVNDTNFQWILHYTADKLRGKIKDAEEQLKKYL